MIERHSNPLWKVRSAAWILAALAAPAGAGEVLLPDPSTRFVHRQWTVEDGLPVNNLTDVVQTPDGWLWIASFDGLLRFDGVRFTRFDTVNAPELGSNRIVDLEVGVDGTLWILPERNHPARWAGGRFHAVAVPEGVATDNAIMAVDAEGVPWLSMRGSLFRIEDDSLVPGPRQLEGYQVHRLAAGAGGRIWLNVRGPRAFAVLEAGQLRWPAVGLPSSENVEYLAADAAGALWIGTIGGLWRWHLGTLEKVGDHQTTPGAAISGSPPAAHEAGEPVLRWTEGRIRRFLQRDPEATSGRPPAPRCGAPAGRSWPCPRPAGESGRWLSTTRARYGSPPTARACTRWSPPG